MLDAAPEGVTVSPSLRVILSVAKNLRLSPTIGVAMRDRPRLKMNSAKGLDLSQN